MARFDTPRDEDEVGFSVEDDVWMSKEPHEMEETSERGFPSVVGKASVEGWMRTRKRKERRGKEKASEG